MKTLAYVLAALAVTLCAIVAELHWGLPFRPIALSSPTVDAARIRALFPVHLVNPDWIHASGRALVHRWYWAEIITRSTLILAVWLAGLVSIFGWMRRGRRAHPVRQAPPTPPGC